MIRSKGTTLTLALFLAGCATAGPDVVMVHPDGTQKRCMTINTMMTRANPWYGLTAIPASAVGHSQALDEQKRCVAEARRDGYVERPTQ